MKKPLKSCVSLLALAVLLSPAAARADGALVKNLVDFGLQAKKAAECRLVSAAGIDAPVKIYKKSKLTADVVTQVGSGAPCTQLESSQRDDIMWFKVDVGGKRGWARFDEVVFASGVTPVAGGKSALLTFRPTCEDELTPCKRAARLVMDAAQRTIDMKDGQFAVDARGQNVFYDELVVQQMGKKPTWNATIYRYNVGQNAVSKVAQGFSPTVHPKNDILYFRTFRGEVMVSDFSGRAVRVLYTPPETTTLYVDAKGIAVPITGNEQSFSWSGYRTGPVKIFVSPEDNLLPKAVQFSSADKIRVLTPYADGKINATVTIDATAK